jgi:hypothetical protein
MVILIRGSVELIKNGLVRRNYVIKFFGSPHKRKFPEPEGIADDEQFGVGTFFFQLL